MSDFIAGYIAGAVVLGSTTLLAVATGHGAAGATVAGVGGILAASGLYLLVKEP